MKCQVNVSSESPWLKAIVQALESLNDGTGTVWIDCHQGEIKQIRRQDAIKPQR